MCPIKEKNPPINLRKNRKIPYSHSLIKLLKTEVIVSTFVETVLKPIVLVSNDFRKGKTEPLSVLVYYSCH